MLINIGSFAVDVAVSKRKPARETELVFADELRVGDHVLIEAKVTNYMVYGSDPSRRHVHVSPVGRLWNASDKWWTWGWRMQSDTAPSFRRVVK